MPYTDKQIRGQPYVFVDWNDISIGKFQTIMLPFPSSSLPFNARREPAICVIPWVTPWETIQSGP
eukprot:scaffold44348_cov110-Skeletonema_marinoi.AAC.1